ncbi:MAG TPA: hypothetical protein VKA41_12170 [Solirubrobacterales bacterium]|nr:hypothetical protein [Solirubrobacterales bacterium]
MTTAAVEQRLAKAGFHLEGRLLAAYGREDLWAHDDDPDRTFSTTEALEEIEQKKED